MTGDAPVASTGLALCHRVTLDSVAHWWVTARTPTVHQCHYGRWVAHNKVHAQHRNDKTKATAPRLSYQHSDSSPACKASDVFVLFTPDFTPHRICHIFQFVYHAHISTHCRVTVFLEIPLSQQRSHFNQTPDVFSRRHGSVTEAHWARCLAHVGPIFNECCHCHCQLNFSW